MSEQNNTNSFRSELESWIDVWDQVEAEGLQEPSKESSELPDVIQEDVEVNPIHPDSKGPDSETTPPVWVKEDLLKVIEDLKNDMFEIENQIASELGGDGEWLEKFKEIDFSKLDKKIAKLRGEIEKVSSKLGVE